MRNGDGRFLVQAQQHLRFLVAEEIDQAVVQAAIARPRIERDIGQVERAQRLGDDVAAESGGIRPRRNGPLDGWRGAMIRNDCRMRWNAHLVVLPRRPFWPVFRGCRQGGAGVVGGEHRL